MLSSCVVSCCTERDSRGEKEEEEGRGWEEDRMIGTSSTPDLRSFLLRVVVCKFFRVFCCCYLLYVFFLSFCLRPLITQNVITLLVLNGGANSEGEEDKKCNHGMCF